MVKVYSRKGWVQFGLVFYNIYVCYECLPFCPVFGAWKSVQEGLDSLRIFRGLFDSIYYAKFS